MSERQPVTELGARMWAEHGDQMRAQLDQRPPLTPAQVREIRGIWLSILMREAKQ